MSKSSDLLELKKYKKPSFGMAFLLLAIWGVQVSLFGLWLLAVLKLLLLGGGWYVLVLALAVLCADLLNDVVLYSSVPGVRIACA